MLYTTRQERSQRLEINPFRIAAGDEHYLIRKREPGQSGHGGTEIGRFGIVHVNHAGNFSDMLKTVGETAESRQPFSQIGKLDPGFHQRTSRQCVEHVVIARQWQRRYRQDRASAPAKLLLTSNFPNAPVRVDQRRAKAEADGTLAPDRNGPWIIAVVNQTFGARIYPVFAGLIALHVTVHIQMVFGDVENSRASERQFSTTLELKARKLQDITRVLFLEKVQGRIADVSADSAIDARAFEQMTSPGGNRAFTVRARNAYHVRISRHIGKEHIYVADQTHTSAARARDKAVVQRKAGAEHSFVNIDVGPARLVPPDLQVSKLRRRYLLRCARIEHHRRYASALQVTHD